MHESLHLPLIHKQHELDKGVLACFLLRHSVCVYRQRCHTFPFFFSGVNTGFTSCPFGWTCAVLRCLHGVRVAKGFMIFSIGEYVTCFDGVSSSVQCSIHIMYSLRSVDYVECSPRSPPSNRRSRRLPLTVGAINGCIYPK